MGAKPTAPIDQQNGTDASAEGGNEFRWGGAVNSAREDGTYFFDQPRAQAFESKIGKKSKYLVRLRSRYFLPVESAPVDEVLKGSKRQYVYLQFHRNPNNRLRGKLRRVGIHLARYVDARTWIARGTARGFGKARTWPTVRALSRIDPRDKLSPELFKGIDPQHAQLEDGGVRCSAVCLGSDRGDWERSTQSNGVHVISKRRSCLGTRYELSGKREGIVALATRPETHYIAYIPPPAEPRDATIDSSSNVEDVRDEPPGVDGNGEVVAIREVQLVVTHPDFMSRFTPVDTQGTLDPQHATGVTGQVGGDGTTVPEAKGVAPKATLLGYELEFESQQPGGSAFATDDIQDADDRGARISNHSYGPTGVGDGQYSLESAEWDGALRYKNPAGLLAFFASNELNGTGNSTAGDFLQIDSFVGAKNGICVSATNDQAHAGDNNPATPKSDGIANFVDFGPMADGRVKPDIVANGDSVTLLQGSSGSYVGDGTSFACPAVAGMAALLFQYYKSKLGGGAPSAALAKGLLLNCATDLGQVGPDAVYGYGMANIERVIDMINIYELSPAGNKPWFEGTMTSEGEEQTFEFTIGEQSEIKVMLVWLDPPGTPAAQNVLVNDLDMEITRSLTKYHPYSLNPQAPSAPATATGPNTVDCVEQIIIPNPEPGKYQIKIKATKLPVPADPQSFAVVLCKDSEMEVTITAQPAAPGVVQSNIAYLPVTGGDVAFNVSIVGGKAPYTLNWDFDGDGTTDRTDTAPGTSFLAPAHTFPPGANQYTVKLEIEDDTAPPNKARTNAVVQVINPPIAVVIGSPPQGDAPLEVFFSGLGSSGIIANYTWDFGDGTAPQSTTGQTTSHIYGTQGQYVASMFVTDIVGQISTTVTMSVEATKRTVESFPHRLRAKLNYGGGTGKMVMILVVAELAFPRSEAKQMIKDGTFDGRTFSVMVDPDGAAFELGPFTIDARGRAKTVGRSFRVLFSRKGHIVLKVNSGDVLTAFKAIGLTQTTPSNDKRDPRTYYTFPVKVEADDVVYTGDFQLIWTNKNQKRASAKNP